MNPLDTLRPNYLPDSTKNYGIEELIQNKGLGVKEINQQAFRFQEQQNPLIDNLRTAKARQFGKTKETVGF